MKETVTFIVGIMLCVLMAGAFVSAWRLHRRQWAGLKTRYIEKDLGHCSYAWVCEQCGDARSFDYPLTEDLGWKHCPQCGRKITEFVPYVDPLDEFVEE